MAALVVLAILAAGCSKQAKPRPFAAESDVPSAEGIMAAVGFAQPETHLDNEFEAHVNEVLAPEEQREVLAIMGGVSDDHEIVERPVAAPTGRWSDLELAVREAGWTRGVEMSVSRVREKEWGTIFDLITVESRPAQLIVRRTEEPPGWSATATVGRFGDDTTRAAALLKAVDKQMRAYGKKRKFAERP